MSLLIFGTVTQSQEEKIMDAYKKEVEKHPDTFIEMRFYSNSTGLSEQDWEDVQKYLKEKYGL